MKPVHYRNRQPLEYTPHDLRLVLKTRRFYDHIFIPRRRRRKLPGRVVGSVGIVLVTAGELIKGQFGMLLFVAGILLLIVGLHFEILNRVAYEYKYFIVPVVVLALFGLYLVRPQMFRPLFPKQYVTQLVHLSAGFPFTSDRLTIIFGGKGMVSVTYTKQQLEQAKTDSLVRSRGGIPFIAYQDSSRLFIDADVYAGEDSPPILIRRNVVSGLPFKWDGNFNSRALEIVNPDTLPVFQLVYLSKDTIRIRGVFQAKGKLVIVDESGVTEAQGKRVLFYGTRAIFKYPSWKYPGQLFSTSQPDLSKSLHKDHLPGKK